MIILIGLGNPGKKYASTRHNAGKILAAWLKAEGGLMGFKIVETDCFMNKSGEWIKNKMATMDKMATMVKTSNHSNHSSHSNHSNRFNHLFIAHDDLDLPLGSFKIHFGRGPRLHQGILSIEQALATKNFWRIRIGIDNRKSRLISAKISQHPPAIAFGDSRWRAGQIADKSAESDSGLSDLIHNPILADASRFQPAFSVSGEEYVLQPFKRGEKIILKQTFKSIKSVLLQHCTKNTRSRVFSDSKLKLN